MTNLPPMSDHVQKLDLCARLSGSVTLEDQVDILVDWFHNNTSSPYYGSMVEAATRGFFTNREGDDISSISEHDYLAVYEWVDQAVRYLMEESDG